MTLLGPTSRAQIFAAVRLLIYWDAHSDAPSGVGLGSPGALIHRRVGALSD
jgi:hypothetical protein